MPTLFVAPTANFVQTTLNGAITSAAVTITLNSVTSLQAPGYVVIDRTDSNGTSTPSAREVVYYTGISGSNLTGATRGADGSTARSHSDGAVVETMPTTGMWNSLTTIVASGLDTQGLLLAIASPVTIGQLNIASYATISQAYLTSRLDVSAASVTGLGFYPVFRSSANFSGPTTFVGGLLSTPRIGTIKWVSVLTRFVVSTASIGFDFRKNGTSIFANATTRPAIAAGGTFVSSASIGTINVATGDILMFAVDSAGTNAFVTDLTGQIGTL